MVSWAGPNGRMVDWAKFIYTENLHIIFFVCVFWSPPGLQSHAAHTCFRPRGERSGEQCNGTLTHRVYFFPRTSIFSHLLIVGSVHLISHSRSKNQISTDQICDQSNRFSNETKTNKQKSTQRLLRHSEPNYSWRGGNRTKKNSTTTQTLYKYAHIRVPHLQSRTDPVSGTCHMRSCASTHFHRLCTCRIFGFTSSPI